MLFLYFVATIWIPVVFYSIYYIKPQCNPVYIKRTEAGEWEFVGSYNTKRIVRYIQDEVPCERVKIEFEDIAHTMMCTKEHLYWPIELSENEKAKWISQAVLKLEEKDDINEIDCTERILEHAGPKEDFFRVPIDFHWLFSEDFLLNNYTNAILEIFEKGSNRVYKININSNRQTNEDNCIESEHNVKLYQEYVYVQ